MSDKINLFNRWKVKKLYFWIGVGSLPVLCIIFFFTFALFGGGMGGAMDAAYEDQIQYLQFDAAGPEAFGGGEPSTAEMFLPATQPAARIDMGDQILASNGSQIPTERLIIRDGNISIQVDDTRDSRDAIEAMVSGMADKGAFVISSSEHGGYEEEDNPYISMVIRVPSSEFDRVMDKLAEMAVKVTERNESAQDVTEEYIDLQNRIEALDSARQRLLEIMRNADTTEDLLQAEAQLTMREAELEALQGRLQYLSQAAKLSRISISLQPYILSQPIDSKWRPAETARWAVENLLDSMRNFADWFIYFAIATLPWLIFWGLIIWGVVSYFRRRKDRKAEKEAKE
jgi:hypothetical protein